MKMPSTQPPEVRSNGRPGDDEGCLWSGTLLRRGPSLLARNEHLPCETVVPKSFFSSSLILNYQPLSSKRLLITLSGESGKGPLSEGRVLW